MGKYPISPEFRPFDRFTPPISRPFLALTRTFMGEPRWLYRDGRLSVRSWDIGPAGGRVRLLLISPRDIASPAPCLFYAHGGGFVLKAAPYHYTLACRYALEGGCRVLFVQYRLAPKYPFPAPFDDCYLAYTHLLKNAAELGVDVGNIGVAGDSAGAALAVGTALRLRDTSVTPGPRFQMLPYPFLDLESSGESARLYTDTPMWNSRLSRRVDRYTKPDRSRPDYIYCSPLSAPDLSGLPPAYIEVAEFDCLRDDGVRYAERLRALGIPARLNETRGTMHGFDIVSGSPTAAFAIAQRIDFIRRSFGA